MLVFSPNPLFLNKANSRFTNPRSAQFQPFSDERIRASPATGLAVSNFAVKAEYFDLRRCQLMEVKNCFVWNKSHGLYNLPSYSLIIVPFF